MTKQELHTLKQSIRILLKSLSTELDNIKEPKVLQDILSKLTTVNSEIGNSLIDQHLIEVELLRAKLSETTDK